MFLDQARCPLYFSVCISVERLEPLHAASAATAAVGPVSAAVCSGTLASVTHSQITLSASFTHVRTHSFTNHSLSPFTHLLPLDALTYSSHLPLLPHCQPGMHSGSFNDPRMQQQHQQGPQAPPPQTQQQMAFNQAAQEPLPSTAASLLMETRQQHKGEAVSGNSVGKAEVVGRKKRSIKRRECSKKRSTARGKECKERERWRTQRADEGEDLKRQQRVQSRVLFHVLCTKRKTQPRCPRP